MLSTLSGAITVVKQVSYSSLNISYPPRTQASYPCLSLVTLFILTPLGRLRTITSTLLISLFTGKKKSFCILTHISHLPSNLREENVFLLFNFDAHTFHPFSPFVIFCFIYYILILSINCFTSKGRHVPFLSLIILSICPLVTHNILITLHKIDALHYLNCM